jgi:hypothetical protein
VDVRAIPNRSFELSTTGTNFPISQNLHHILDRMMPHSQLRCNFSVILRSCLTSSSTFCLLCSVATVLCRPQRGWSAMSVFPSVKYFTHLLTLLTPMQASPYTPRSRS